MIRALTVLALLLGPAVARAAPPVVAVLVAGDDSLPVFDDATRAMAERLATRGAAITRLSADPREGVVATSLPHVLDAIVAMHPAAGQSCLVFMTSHGEHDGGFALFTHHDPDEVDLLRPVALDRALRTGCGGAPTVVIVSSCFSGRFARAPMTRPNRVILTAARPDRPSFGCGAERKMTVFDACLLSELDRDADWTALSRATRRCVQAAEAEFDELPSEPQTFIGSEVQALPVPVIRPPVPHAAAELAGVP